MMSTNIIPFFSALVMSASEPPTTDVQNRPPTEKIAICNVTAESPAQLYESILALPETKVIQQTSEYLSTTSKGGQIWTLVINNHPAAPAAICRTVAPDNGKSTLDMSIVCFAAKPACDKLAEDFARHNEAVVKSGGK